MSDRTITGKMLRSGLSALAGIMLFAGLDGAVQAAERADDARGAAVMGQASATILNPTALRTDALFESSGDFADISGLPVTPAAVVRRGCREDGARQHCDLVILDMP